jgi:hypothetical protein
MKYKVTFFIDQDAPACPAVQLVANAGLGRDLHCQVADGGALGGGS